MLSAEADFGGGYERVHANASSELWQQLIRERPPARCRGCGSPVSGVDTEVRIKHFRHHVEPDRCIFENESPAHLRLKYDVAAAVRSLDGWGAGVEARAADGAWVADVLAYTDDKQRWVAFEIQLSQQDRQWANERQQRRTQDGIDCLWLLGPHGIGPANQSVHLPDPETSVVNIGVYHQPPDPEWSPHIESKPIPLDGFVQQYLTGDVVLVDGLDHPLSAEDADHYRKWERSNQRRVAEQERHARNIDALTRRQYAVAKTILPGLLDRYGPPIQVGDTTWPARPSIIKEHADIDTMTGLHVSDYWARGLAIRHNNKVIALVCPVGSRIPSSKPGPRLHGVPVYCHPQDHNRIASHYTGNLTVIDAPLDP